MSEDSRRATEGPVGKVESPIALLGRRGFTPAEIGIVSLIFAVLAGIAVPVFSGYQERSARAYASGTCMSHVKGLGLAVLAYLQDNDDAYPVCNRTYLAPDDSDTSVVQASWMRHILPYVMKSSAQAAKLAGRTDAARAAEAFSCPATAHPDDTQLVYGVRGDRQASVRLPRRDLGANGLLFYLANDPTGRQAQAVSQHDLGRPECLPVLADSSSFLWTDPRYLIFSSYISATAPNNTVAWAKELTEKDFANPDPAFARHHGGVNILFGDGHSVWRSQNDLGADPARHNEAFQLNYKLPFVPVDRVDRTTGAVTLTQDDRLR